MDERPPRPAEDGFLRARDARELRRSLNQPTNQPQDGPTHRLPRSGRHPVPGSPAAGRPPHRSGGPPYQPGPPPDDRPTHRLARPGAPPRRPGPPPPRLRRDPADDRARAIRTAKIALAVVSVLVLALTGYAWATFQQLTNRLTTTPVIGLSAPDGATDILLVGNDSRFDAQGRPLSPEILAKLRSGANEAELTDTLVLIRIPNDGRSAVGISIPRDTFVEVAGGHGRHKINSAYSRGKNAEAAELREDRGRDAASIDQAAALEGRKTLVKTIENLTGAGIDHYAEVNMLGFYEITQAIGGVEVCLNRATRDADSGANFKAGRQTISGADALAFVRQRKNLPRGDLDRIVRQQVFMAAVADKVLSAGTLANPGKLRALIASLQRSIVLDDKLDPLQFAEQMRGIASGAIQFVTIPVLDIGARTADGDAVTVDEDAVRRFVEGHASGAAPAEAATSDNARITVEVRNASGVTGLAGRVLDELANQGFARGEASNAATRKTSVVRHASGEQQAGARVAQALGGLPTEQDANLPTGHVRVFLGQDYTGPGTQRMGAGPLVGLDGGPALAQPPSGAPPVTASEVPCVD